MTHAHTEAEERVTCIGDEAGGEMTHTDLEAQEEMNTLSYGNCFLCTFSSFISCVSIS